MWTRRELKEKAKSSLKLNYWKAVLVAFLAIAIGGGVGGAGGASSAASNITSNTAHVQTTSYDSDYYTDLDTLEVYDEELGDEELPEIVNRVQEETHGVDSAALAAGVGMAFALVLIISLVALAIAIALDAFVINPVEVGADRFFLRNLNQPAEVKEVAFAFDNNYKEIVKAMILRDVFIILWSLLLVIPGIIKAYEYRMIAYLMADDPTLTREQAFQMSKSMMNGNKWKTFVLDLSFIGWDILSVLTLGILAIFYVSPYKQLTCAALYESLRYGGTNANPTSQEMPQLPVPPYAE